jgi:hypothetical protein
MSEPTERLSPKTLRWLNRELAQTGLRVCKVCQGHPLPLTRQHFYQHHGYFDYVCIPCYSARETERALQRYHSDPECRRRKNEQSRAWWLAHLELHRERNRQGAARRRTERKLAGLKRVLGKPVERVVLAAEARLERRQA